ncbi:MAG TPA: hypothetical protein VGD55_00310, partial [Acidothermaceae bacterium]
MSAINPELGWELGPGHKAQHVLCVTAGGVAAVRPTAERWLRAAPPVDSAWEYIAAKAAHPLPLDDKLVLGTWTLNIAETRFGIVVEESRLEVDVTCFHPHFPVMPEDARNEVMFIVLDWLLGEDDIERWVGHL